MSDILEEARKLTTQDRQNTYGHPIHDFTRAVELYTPILKSDIDPRLKHALLMIQIKIARLLNTPTHRDSIVDIAGYINCYAMVLEELSTQHIDNTVNTGSVEQN